MHFGGLLLLFILLSLVADAQRLDAIGKQEPLKITGGISTNQTAYFANGINGRRSPYIAFVNANLNLDIYGWSVPFSFSISNQSKGRFQQPFNQYSLNPSYKWITAHIGYTSMSFSSYTLNNHLFSGAGIDLTPRGAFKFSVMYGRLQKAVVADTLLVGNSIQPAYKRIGYGVKASYAQNKDIVDLIVFKAEDLVHSNPEVAVSSIIAPQANLVGGINISKAIFKKFVISGELGLSALTRNKQHQADSLSDPFKKLGFLLNTNNTTALHTAYKTGLAYGGRRYTLGLGYERISPEYKTLGAYYFANDFENITANLATKLLKDKVSLSLSSGIQHDDLRKDKQSASKRIVGSLNMAYQASKKLNLSGTYSNFQSYVNIRSSFNKVNELTPYDNLDTLNYTQIAQNINLNGNYILSQSKEKTKVLNVNCSVMASADKQGGIVQNSGGAFYNLNTSYSINFIPRNFSVNYTLNLSSNKAAGVQNTTVGPTVGLNRSFLNKKLRSSASTSWNASYANGTNTSSVINLRLNNSYTVKKKHSLNLSMVALNRGAGKGGSYGGKHFNEFTSTLGYNYNF